MTMRNNHSPRCTFQYKYFDAAPETVPPQVLNIGSCDDPLGFGVKAMHFDIDDWSAACKYFTRGNAEELPFPDGSYHTVIMGDMLEHVKNPWLCVQEAARVVAPGGVLVITIFEEWRLPGHGQWIKEGQELADETCRKMGFTDREDFQVKSFPNRVGTPDDDVNPHLIHINQFDDDDIKGLCLGVMNMHGGFSEIEFVKAGEATHEGHTWYNWLLAFRKGEEGGAA